MKAIKFIYSITNIESGKVYIGQTNNPKRRWKAHQRLAKYKQEQYIHRAMAKYGIDIFIFEVIASCGSKEAADSAERTIISQFNSCNKDYGYNIKPGGNTQSGFRFSEEAKQKMKDNWHIDHPPESIKKTHEACRGRKNSEEHNAAISKANKGKQFCLGHKQPEEVIKKRNKALAAIYVEKYGDKVCSIDDCNRGGNRDGYQIDGKRYCSLHITRFRSTGRFDLRDKSEHKPQPPMTQETKDKISMTKKGSVPINVSQFTADQLSKILSDPRGAGVIAKDFGVSKQVILRLRKKHNINMEELYLKAYGKITAPRIILNKPPPHSEEQNRRHSEMMKGREAPNKTKLTPEQINIIVTDPRIGRVVADEVGITHAVLKRIRREHSAQLAASLLTKPPTE